MITQKQSPDSPEKFKERFHIFKNKPKNIWNDERCCCAGFVLAGFCAWLYFTYLAFAEQYWKAFSNENL